MSLLNFLFSPSAGLMSYDMPQTASSELIALVKGFFKLFSAFQSQPIVWMHLNINFILIFFMNCLCSVKQLIPKHHKTNASYMLIKDQLLALNFMGSCLFVLVTSLKYQSSLKYKIYEQSHMGTIYEFLESFSEKDHS